MVKLKKGKKTTSKKSSNKHIAKNYSLSYNTTMTKKNDDNKNVKKGQKNNFVSTQRYLQFSEVHDDVLVLKNGSIRAVLEVSSINFNLKSEQEQQAIIQGYQRFLNALNFPIQIQVRSRKLDIDKYLDDLRIRQRKHTNDLLRLQMSSYIEYIEKLVEYSDIMEKRFFVVVPITPPRAEKKGAIASFLEYIKPSDTAHDIIVRKKEFKNLKRELEARIETVKTALENCGLNITQLDTQKIIELFYQAYNPDRARTQKYSSSEEMAVVGDPGENLVADEK